MAITKAGTYWLADEPDQCIRDRGHFSELPEGYVFTDGFVYDADEPLQICTVGDKNPRDIANYTKMPDDGNLQSPAYRVGVCETDIKLRIRVVDSKPEHQCILKWCSAEEKTFLGWCLRAGIQPECKEAGWSTTMWNLEYSGLFPDDRTLEALSLVKVHGQYIHILNRILGCVPLGKDHPLHKFIGLDYAEIKALAQKSTDRQLQYLYGYFGKYSLAWGTAKFEGEEFTYHLPTHYTGREELILPYSGKAMRAILTARKGQVIQFTGYGELRIPIADVGKLNLSTPVVAKDWEHNSVVLLPKNYPKGMYQPATRSIQLKFQKLQTYPAYRTTVDGENKPIKVYNSQATYEKRERKQDRIKRLGAESYIGEIDISKWGDTEIESYVKYRNGMQRGEYTVFTKESPEIASVLQYCQTRDNDFVGLNWIGSALDLAYDLDWGKLTHAIRVAGVGGEACGKLFMRSDCVNFADALQHFAEMNPGRIHSFLQGIVAAFAKIGPDRMRTLGLQLI